MLQKKDRFNLSELVLLLHLVEEALQTEIADDEKVRRDLIEIAEKLSAQTSNERLPSSGLDI